MNVESTKEQLQSEQQTLLKSIYTKSAEFKSFMSNWRKSIKDFDITQVLNEKATRIQEAMSILYMKCR